MQLQHNQKEEYEIQIRKNPVDMHTNNIFMWTYFPRFIQSFFCGWHYNWFSFLSQRVYESFFCWMRQRMAIYIVEMMYWSNLKWYQKKTKKNINARMQTFSAFIHSYLWFSSLMLLALLRRQTRVKIWGDMRIKICNAWYYITYIHVEMGDLGISVYHLSLVLTFSIVMMRLPPLPWWLSYHFP